MRGIGVMIALVATGAITDSKVGCIDVAGAVLRLRVATVGDGDRLDAGLDRGHGGPSTDEDVPLGPDEDENH